MESAKKISFIILTWNSGKVIGACLASIAGLKQPAYEIVLVDNGSSDNTRDLIEAFMKEHPGIEVKKVWLDKNYGTTVSRNTGVREADPGSDYICILDSDTVINQQAMEELIAVLEEDPRNAVTGPSMVNLDREPQVTAKKIPTAFLKFCKAFPLRSVQKIGENREKYDFTDDRRSYPVGYLISACWMLRKKRMEEIGPLDEKIFYSPEDVEYCVRAWTKGFRVLYCPKARIIHATQRISKKKLISRHNWEHLKGLVYFFSKYGLFFTSRKIDIK